MWRRANKSKQPYISNQFDVLRSKLVVELLHLFKLFTDVGELCIRLLARLLLLQLLLEHIDFALHSLGGGTFQLGDRSLQLFDLFAILFQTKPAIRIS